MFVLVTPEVVSRQITRVLILYHFVKMWTIGNNTLFLQLSVLSIGLSQKHPQVILLKKDVSKISYSVTRVEPDRCEQTEGVHVYAVYMIRDGEAYMVAYW